MNTIKESNFVDSIKELIHHMYIESDKEPTSFLIIATPQIITKLKNSNYIVEIFTGNYLINGVDAFEITLVDGDSVKVPYRMLLSDIVIKDEPLLYIIPSFRESGVSYRVE